MLIGLVTSNGRLPISRSDWRRLTMPVLLRCLPFRLKRLKRTMLRWMPWLKTSQNFRNSWQLRRTPALKSSCSKSRAKLSATWSHTGLRSTKRMCYLVSCCPMLRFWWTWTTSSCRMRKTSCSCRVKSTLGQLKLQLRERWWTNRASNFSKRKLSTSLWRERLVSWTNELKIWRCSFSTKRTNSIRSTKF